VYLKNSKETLAEILNMNNPFPPNYCFFQLQLIEQSNVSREALYSFINTSMGKISDLNTDIDNLIKKAALSPEN